jgi:hypothetical protein
VSKRVFRGTRETEEVKIRRESGGNYSRREVPGVFTEISG